MSRSRIAVAGAGVTGVRHIEETQRSAVAELAVQALALPPASDAGRAHRARLPLLRLQHRASGDFRRVAVRDRADAEDFSTHHDAANPEGDPAVRGGDRQRDRCSRGLLVK